jgi:hypothetical protein
MTVPPQVKGKPTLAFIRAGMWEPIADANWTAWSQDPGVKASALATRGNLGLFYDASQDAIIDIGNVPSMDLIGPGSGGGNPK